MPDIKTIIVFGDAHAPDHDLKAVNIVKNIAYDIHPDLFIDLGDSGELASISHFDKFKPLPKEGRRLQKDLSSMYSVSMYITNDFPNARKVKLMGNHEQRVERYIEEHSELAELESLSIVDAYKRLGWFVVPNGEFHREGKLIFHHGDRLGYQGMYHAAAWSQLGRSIVYGHRHDVQRFTREMINSNGTPDRHAAFSIGCLRKLTPDWMENRKNNWQQGFAIIYLQPDGMFNLYHVDIIKGKAVWNGTLYRG